MNQGERRKSFAAPLVFCAVLIFTVFYAGTAAWISAANGPTVVDWGVFDVAGGSETSMREDNSILEGSAGTTLYVRFSNNVAGEHLLENNLPRFSVVDESGNPVRVQVWVKPTQEEFQYRQYIFITLTEDLDEDREYRILIAPGVQANNRRINEEGDTISFAYAPGGGGEEPPPEPATDDVPPNSLPEDSQGGLTDPTGSDTPGVRTDPSDSGGQADPSGPGRTDPTEPAAEDPEKKPEGTKKKETGTEKEDPTKNNDADRNENTKEDSPGAATKESGSKSRATAAGRQTRSASRPAVQGTTSSPVILHTDTAEGGGGVHRLSASVAAQLNGGESNAAQEGTTSESRKKGSRSALVILLPAFLIGCGALTEEVSFRYRLKKRSKTA